MRKPTTSQISIAASFALHAAILGPCLFYNNDTAPNTDKTTEHITTTLPATPTIETALTPVQIQRLAIMTSAMTNEIIELNDTITTESKNQFIRSFKIAQEHTLSPFSSIITVKLDSVGGSVASGYEIMNEIAASTVPTRLICEKQAASMAAILLTTTPNVFSRDAKSNCTIIIHAPYTPIEDAGFRHDIKHGEFMLIQKIINSGTSMNVIELPNNSPEKQDRNEQPVTKKINIETMKTYLANHIESTNRFIQDIAANSNLTTTDATYLINQGDVYFTAIEAQYLGLIDHIEDVTMDEANRAMAHNSICKKLPGLEICSQSMSAMSPEP